MRKLNNSEQAKFAVWIDVGTPHVFAKMTALNGIFSLPASLYFYYIDLLNSDFTVRPLQTLLNRDLDLENLTSKAAAQTCGNEEEKVL